MADRTPPGIREPKGGNRRVAFGCLGIFVGLLVLVGGCTAIASMNQTPYDPNNSREAIAQCEARIEAELRAPATAEFDSSASGSGTWKVTGTVDAENGFGAMIRNDFQCTVVVDGDQLTTTIDFIR